MKLCMTSSCRWCQKNENWVGAKHYKSLLILKLFLFKVCKKQSVSYFCCSTEKSNISSTAEHPPIEIIENQK